MKTNFHLKLEARVKRLRSEDQHWLLKGAKLVRVPSTGEVVTAKRALYAAFVGPIPGGHEVVPGCDNKRCVRPTHQKLVAKAASSARGLSLEEYREQLDRPETFRVLDNPSILPSDLTINKINLVKYLSHNGHTLQQIQEATQLPLDMIMRIRGKVYDAATRHVSGGSIRRRSDKDLYKKKSPADIEGVLPDPPDHSLAPPLPVPDDISEEELLWLKMVR